MHDMSIFLKNAVLLAASPLRSRLKAISQEWESMMNNKISPEIFKELKTY